MRNFLTLILAIALGASSAHAKVDRDPVALIQAIYATYRGDNPGLADIYSQRLQALVDKDEQETPEGEVGRMDWDAFVNGQDWKLTELKIVPVSQQGDHAQVRATFKNFDTPNDMLFDLVREKDGWRIDDIQATLKPRWTMSKILTDAPDASRMPMRPPIRNSLYRRLLRYNRLQPGAFRLATGNLR